MGAYLSKPETEKKSEDFSDSERLSYGVSRMQGWRISMEDAHNCIPNFSDENSLFGVFDGHGGSEVAMYCALHISDLLKNLESYKSGDFESALKEAFMKLDEELLKPNAIRELKVLADRDLDDPPPSEEDIRNAELQRKDEEDCEEDEMAMLHEEATMSIEDLLSRYGKISNETKKALKKGDDKNDDCQEKPGSSSSPSNEAEIKPADTSEANESSISQSKTDCAPSVSSSSTSTLPDSSKQDTADVSSSSEVEASNSNQPSSASNAVASSQVSSSDDTPPKSAPIPTSPEQSAEISSSDSGEATNSSLKVKPGKINPKGKVGNLGLADDLDFEPELSGSDSEQDDGFDSDEAVEGSSESDNEDSSDEDDSEEDPDDVHIPLQTFASNKEEPGKDSGTTAVVSFLNNYELYVANAGDSRCVLCRDGAAVDMSEDHKPEDEKELSRIQNAGGHVTGGRVNGGLNLSRAIGDHCYKLNDKLKPAQQVISAMPDVKKITLKKGDQFMVLACDGIWNSLSSQDVVDFVLARLNSAESEKKETLSSICEELMTKCLAPDTTGDGTGCDNMTCIIVEFNADWLAKSPALDSDKVSQDSSVGIKTEDGSGEAVKNTVNGTKPLEAAVKNAKRQLDASNDCTGANDSKKPKLIE